MRHPGRRYHRQNIAYTSGASRTTSTKSEICGQICGQPLTTAAGSLNTFRPDLERKTIRGTNRTCAKHRRSVHRRSSLQGAESVKATVPLSPGWLHVRLQTSLLRCGHLATSRLPCGIQEHCGRVLGICLHTLCHMPTRPSASDGDDVRCHPHRRAHNMYRLLLWGAPRLRAALIPAYRLLPFRR